MGPWLFSESDVINMLNFNSGLQWNEQLSLGLFVQNIINDRGFAKVEVGLGRGKKKFDKRESIKDKDTKREMDRAMKKYK